MKYTKSYKDGNYRDIDGFEVPVRLPDKPELRHFRNYGKDIVDQKFHREEIPQGVELWAVKELDDFVDKMWHLRRNGEWWLIKGHEVYVPGYAWFYFNSWQIEAGGYAKFRMEAIDYFQVAEAIIDNPQAYGLLIIKCRRLGDTEKSLCLGYDMCTRFRNSWFGMQNIVDTDAKENYERIMVAHNNMMPWFKPKHKGSDDPAKGIRFQFGGKAESERTGIDMNASPIKSLYSKIDYRATVLKAYDGKRIRYYHLDEYGKIPSRSMPVKRQWGVIKQCLSLNNGLKIVGKAMFTTTVEDIKDGETVGVCRDLWRDSNPKILQPNGRTVTGLIRYYRNYKLAADVDEYGFHKVEEATAVRQQQIDAFVSAGDDKELSNYKRQLPDDINDALSIPSVDCILYPAKLDRQITKCADYKRGIKQADFIPCERYNLHWNGDPMKSSVRAEQNDNGRFWISQHPIIPNAFGMNSELITPGNVGIYSGGIDGFDHREGTSDGGLSIFMPRNDLYEDKGLEWEYNQMGVLVPVKKGLMKTNRFVLTYKYRPPEPEEFYMDCAKALIYFGAKALPEQDKPGVIRYFERYKLQEYLAYKPWMLKIGQQNQKERGVKASTQFISSWQELVQSHVHHYWETYTHGNQLEDFRSFTGLNRQDCDQVVASGHAIALGHQFEVMNERKKSNNNRWRSLPV